MIDLTWIIKVDRQPESARWRVHYWLRNPPENVFPNSQQPYVMVFSNPWAERKARIWAEKIATSWEESGEPWEIDETSL